MNVSVLILAGSPPENVVKLGVQDGLNQWSKINDIKFTYTKNKLDADIIVQQQIGDATSFGNAISGCLFEQQQCTIQLFSDVNVENKQTLVNRKSIEFTIAHEFGHLIGLPHHIDPGHVMRTTHADNVRTYYEARGVNVPELYEPRNYERVLANNPPDTRTSNSEPGTSDTQTPTAIGSSQTLHTLKIHWLGIKQSHTELTAGDIEIVKLYAVSLVNDIIDTIWNLPSTAQTKIGGLTTMIDGLTTIHETVKTISGPITTTTPDTVIVLHQEGSSVPGCENFDNCLVPSTVTINAGGTVVWKNVDNAAHTVTSGVLFDGGPDGLFDSGLFVPDTEFSLIFNTPGEYPYFCLVHPWKSGMVIVLD